MTIFMNFSHRSPSLIDSGRCSARGSEKQVITGQKQSPALEELQEAEKEAQAKGLGVWSRVWGE